MAVTIKTIAELCGVSRGTVDRVLNKRGRVNSDTETLIREVAEQMGYTPNRAGKALAARKKALNIGAVLCAEGNAFFDDVVRGIRQAGKELEDYGVTLTLENCRGYDVDRQLDMIHAMENDVHALLLTPVNDSRIANLVSSLTGRGIMVVTLNNDIENARRTCYVGSDYFRGGEAAGGMLGLLTGGYAKVGILTGSIKILGHSQRITGFHRVIQEKYPHIEAIDFAETNDDDVIAYEVTMQMLRSHPEINALFIVASGAYGVCRAVLSSGRQERMKIVAFDSVPATVEMMRRGLIQATICQQPYQQGYQAMKIAFERLISGPDSMETTEYIVKNEIKILENL